MEIQRSISDLLSSLKNIPSLPHVLLQLIRVCNEENNGLNDLSRIIEKDPGLTGRVLKVVNSAYYSPSNRLKTVNAAVRFLGSNAIRNIAICSSVHTVLHGVHTKSAFNIKQFWWHSLRCAILAKLMAKKTRYRDPDEAFLSGMLHDIGKIVLWINFPEPYARILSMHQENPQSILAEEMRMAASHAEIGAGLLKKWNFPSFVVDAVLYHHAPPNEISNSLPLIKLVYVANALSGSVGRIDPEGMESARAFFGLGQENMNNLMLQADDELKVIAESLEIEIESIQSAESGMTENDREPHQKLTAEMENQAVLLGFLQNLLSAEDEYAILKETVGGIQTLFEIPIVHFFIMDPDKRFLKGETLIHDPTFSMIKDMIVPLQMENSLLITCLKNRKITDSFNRPDDTRSVIPDDQIIRFMGKEGIICLPMISCKESIGVIVMGLDKQEFFALSGQINQLELLAGHAAAAMRIHLLKRFQLQQIQQERMDASTSLARRIIHEVNNPMSIIKNYLRLLGIKLSGVNMAQDEIRIINEEIDRISQILSRLTTFTEDWVHLLETLNVNNLLSDLEKIMGASLLDRNHVRLLLHLDPNLPPVVADRNSLKQVFINLIKNAAEAMENGGGLYIRTRHIAAHVEDSQVKTGYPKHVEIIVRDEGPGIPEEQQVHMFEPFVGAKTGNHAGLGLSIVRNIIEMHKGTIDCQSQAGKGATFRIVLPVDSSLKALAGR